MRTIFIDVYDAILYYYPFFSSFFLLSASLFHTILLFYAYFMSIFTAVKHFGLQQKK